VQRYLRGRHPARVVQIPGRLVNVVTPADGPAADGSAAQTGQ
jgi:hypothetical protein